MEDFLHDYKCACLGINIFSHIATVDHRAVVATDEGDDIIRKFLGLVPSSTDINTSSVENNRLSSVHPTQSKNKFSKSCCLPLPDIVLSCCSSNTVVRPKISPRECGRHLRHLADRFEHRRCAHKNVLPGEVKDGDHKKYFTIFLETLINMSMKLWNILKR